MFSFFFFNSISVSSLPQCYLHQGAIKQAARVNHYSASVQRCWHEREALCLSPRSPTRNPLSRQKSPDSALSQAFLPMDKAYPPPLTHPGQRTHSFQLCPSSRAAPLTGRTQKHGFLLRSGASSTRTLVSRGTRRPGTWWHDCLIRN